MSESYIKSFKTKEDFVKTVAKISTSLRIDSDILSAKLGEVYDLVVPPKEEAPKESDAKKKVPPKEGDK
jgi:hypothetical protein